MRILAAAAALVLIIAQAGAEDAPPSLADLAPALGAGAPEAVLPGGALIHVRLARLGATLEAIDGMLEAAVPEAAVPPQALASAKPPMRMLSLIASLASQGRAPAVPAIIAMSGIDAGSPITLTWYANRFPESWVLSVPVHDPAAVSNLVMGALQPIACDPAEEGGHACWRIQASNPSLPRELVLMRSPDRVFLAAPAAARALLRQGPRLAEDPVVKALPAGDLAVALCAAPFKQILPLVALRVQGLTPANLDPMRDELKRSLGRPMVGMISSRLRSSFGINDLDELLDYAECVAVATAGSVAPAIIKDLQGFDGVGVGLALAPDGVAVQVDVRAAGIEAVAREPLPQPLPLAALGAVPFRPLVVALRGRSRAEAASPLIDAWSAAVLAKLSESGLKPAVLGALIGYLHDERVVPELTDAAPWCLQAQGPIPPVVAPAKTVSDWYAQCCKAMGADTPVMVMPLAGPDPLIAQMTAAAEAANLNSKRWTEAMEPFLGEGWIDRSERFRAEPQAGRPTRLVSESVYTTRSGLFGCSQHELINRVIWECQARDGLLVLQQTVGVNPTSLSGVPGAPTPIAQGLTALAAHVDPGSDAVVLMRLMPALPALVGNLASLEASVRNEIDGYLDQARQILAAHAGDVREARQEIARLGMPTLVARLARSADGSLVCVLAGGLAYPRPQLSPLVHDILAGALAHADEEGGLCVSTRAQPGVYSFSARMDLRGCERLIHDGGNVVAARFLTAPDPRQALAQALGSPDDGNPQPGELLAVNPMWQF